MLVMHKYGYIMTALQSSHCLFGGLAYILMRASREPI